MIIIFLDFKNNAIIICFITNLGIEPNNIYVFTCRFNFKDIIEDIFFFVTNLKKLSYYSFLEKHFSYYYKIETQLLELNLIP